MLCSGFLVLLFLFYSLLLLSSDTFLPFKEAKFFLKNESKICNNQFLKKIRKKNFRKVEIPLKTQF